MKLTQAQIARIKSLENRKGQISARKVLDDAKDDKSPLHSLFNWDLKQAAEKWWLHRAHWIRVDPGYAHGGGDQNSVLRGGYHKERGGLSERRGDEGR